MKLFLGKESLGQGIRGHNQCPRFLVHEYKKKRDGEVLGLEYDSIPCPFKRIDRSPVQNADRVPQ